MGPKNEDRASGRTVELQVDELELDCARCSEDKPTSGSSGCGCGSDPSDSTTAGLGTICPPPLPPPEDESLEGVGELLMVAVTQ